MKQWGSKQKKLPLPLCLWLLRLLMTAVVFSFSLGLLVVLFSSSFYVSSTLLSRSITSCLVVTFLAPASFCFVYAWKVIVIVRMESDFGADLNDDDDWVQSYADYATQEDTYGDYGDEYGASFDEHQKEPTRESLEDLLVSEKIQNPPKRKSKSRKSMPTTTPSTTCDRSRKRKRTKHQSGVEIFLNEVLSWGLRDLLSDCRPTLRLPRLILPSLVYNNFSELTNIVQQVINLENIYPHCTVLCCVLLFLLYAVLCGSGALCSELHCTSASNSVCEANVTVSM